MADTRICHAVLWDVHGGLLDHRVEPISNAPGKRRQDWSERVRKVLLEGGADPQDLMEERLEPLVLWRRRMHEEIGQARAKRTPRGMEIIPERTFQLKVNVALLSWVVPSFMRGLTDQEKVRLARRLWRKRRTDQRNYALDPKMREVVHWLGGQPLTLTLVTAQDRDRALRLLARCQVPMSLFTLVYTSGMIGKPKSHPAFWDAVRERVERFAGRTIQPQETVCIEDNPGIGCNAIRSGMPLLAYDPDGEIDRFIRDELGGILAGAHLLRLEDRWPEQDPFVLCPKNPKEMKKCFEAILRIPRTS